MPSFRIGFGSDFTLKNQRVGVGTADPRATLDVVGTLKGDLNITGVTTLTSYAGFVPQKQSGDGVTITNEVNTISEDIIVSVGKVFTVSAGATANIGTLESVAVGSHFSVPNGGTSLRPEEPVEGTVRFNDDLNTLEFYNGVEWRQFTVTGASGRGYFVGGQINPAPSILTSQIAYVNISTQGNALNFGNLTATTTLHGACASSVRGIMGGGLAPNPATYVDTIEYFTLSTQGNAVDFGNLLDNKPRLVDSLSSSTRGLFACGFNPAASPTGYGGNTNTIDYIEISTTGNAKDFGDATEAKRVVGCFASPTRGFIGGGFVSDSVTTMEFVTISSTGNGIDFGDLTQKGYSPSGCSNSTRGLFAGRTMNPTTLISAGIDYITMASLGNATKFGDMTEGRYASYAVSSQTRGVFAGGNSNPSVGVSNTIDFVTIATTGNAQDFGDNIFTGRYGAGCSDSHGGLGGF